MLCHPIGRVDSAFTTHLSRDHSGGGELPLFRGLAPADLVQENPDFLGSVLTGVYKRKSGETSDGLGMGSVTEL